MNKRSIPFFVCLFIALFGNTNLYAQKEVIVTKDIPLEINLIIDALQKYDANNFTKIYPDILIIDASLRSLSKEDIFMIGKIEVYKTLLRNPGPSVKQPVDGNTVTLLRSALAKSKDHFISWFIGALLKDTQDLIGNPIYKEFLLQKNNDIKIEKPEYRKLEKKGELLQYWITKIAPDAADFPESLKTILIPKMFEALRNARNSYDLMAQQTSMSPLATPLKKESELKFFIVQETNEVKKVVAPAPGEEQKTVEDILGPITDTPKPLPKPTQENWLQENNTPTELKNLPKPNNDAEWLQDF